MPELDQIDVESIKGHRDPLLEQLEQSIEKSLVDSFRADTLEYKRYQQAANLDSTTFNALYQVPIRDIHRDIRENIARSKATLERLIRDYEEDLNHEASPSTQRTEKPEIHNTKVFIAHGHDSGTKETVTRFIELMGFEAVILHEQPSLNRAVIEKFEAYRHVGYAVILLTPDDTGASKRSPNLSKDRARQNVVFELGYFIAFLGREKVCALRKGDVEIPSDYDGIIYISFDESGAWKLELAKEMRAAGLAIDLNKIL